MSSNDINVNKPQLISSLVGGIAISNQIEEVDAIINEAVLDENRNIIYQIQKIYEKLYKNCKEENNIRYYNPKEKQYKLQPYSKHLTFYLLSLYGFDIIGDQDRIEIVRNNKAYLSEIDKEEVLDIKIALYSFASNSTIKDRIIPIFFSKGEGLKEYLADLKTKSEGSDSLSKKYWVLHTLLTNAGVGK